MLDYIRDRLSVYQQETGDIFNLEATPAEGASYRLAKIDKKKYPEVLIFNQCRNGQCRNGSTASKEPYYTNSTQLPVGLTDDIFDALELQDGLQTKYTGGTVFHGYLGERLPSIQATKNLAKTIAENFSLPYFTLTPTFSICETHGYIAGESRRCPECGSSCEVWSRSVGYLRPVDQWNKGKQEEFRERKVYRVQDPAAQPVPEEKALAAER